MHTDMNNDMEWPTWLKNVYWIAVTLAAGVLVFNFPEAVRVGEGKAMQNIAFVVFIALVLAPLFQQVSVFGLKLKSKIDEVKRDIGKQISQIENRIDAHARVNSNQVIDFPDYKPDSDEKLDEIEKNIKLLAKSYGIEGKYELSSADVPEESTFLFKVRYNIEQRLNKIFSDLQEDSNDRPHIPTRHKLDQIAKSEIISPDIINATRSVWSICTLSVHGEEVSEEKLEFVNNTAPELISSLENAADNIGSKDA